MVLRHLVRGTIPWPRLESVLREVADRYGREEIHVRFLEAENWLSTPCVIDEELFVKLVTPQNSMVHALFTAGRNLGAFTSGTAGFFDHFGTPLQMAEHELEATRRMRAIGVNAPEPVEAFEVDGIGVLVLEYLPAFDVLDALDEARVAAVAPDVFAALSTLHDHGLAHGDLRAENVLLYHGEVYFIDATKVNDHNADGARAYDLASALASLEPLIGARRAVAAARTAYDPPALLAAREFLDFVQLRPDHDFDSALLKGELEKTVTEG